MRIGELARAVGVGISTVRFYERRGLLEPSGRSGGNYRSYDDESVRRLRFIRRAQELGFTLGEIEQFLALPSVTDLDQHAVIDLVAGKLDEIDGRIRDLNRLRSALSTLAATGANRERCPVVAALADPPTGRGG
ncbi:heavy metal-responsive transcriptional regulator [Actinoplanes sp. NPDC051851]|uniref:heavy metal-responsive transcriptional regulator n=1 Tax=Actinoplanes sp. NPDC051851 TaxID=3154753 RepID=UPI00343A73B1